MQVMAGIVSTAQVTHLCPNRPSLLHNYDKRVYISSTENKSILHLFSI